MAVCHFCCPRPKYRRGRGLGRHRHHHRACGWRPSQIPSVQPKQPRTLPLIQKTMKRGCCTCGQRSEVTGRWDFTASCLQSDPLNCLLESLKVSVEACGSSEGLGSYIGSGAGLNVFQHPEPAEQRVSVALPIDPSTSACGAEQQDPN